MIKQNKAFTLIELIVVLVILAIIALIVTPLVLNIIDKAQDSANKRSIDEYGKTIELAMQSYKLEHGKYTYDFNDLNIEYNGNKVECDEITLNENGSVFITKCKIDGEYVEDEKTDDGYYQYGGVIFDYKIGDIITYHGITFYVIKNSKKTDSTITLLKAEPLTVDEVNTYGAGHVNRYTYSSVGTAYNYKGYGSMAYYTSTTCGYPTAGNSASVTTGCTTDYAQSEVKYAVDAWAADKFQTNDLKEDETGYSARLITKYELMTYLGYSNEGVKICNVLQFAKSADTPSWVYNSNYSYWTMSPTDDSDNAVYRITSDSMGSLVVYSDVTVRPVVIVLKSAIE